MFDVEPAIFQTLDGNDDRFILSPFNVPFDGYEYQTLQLLYKHVKEYCIWLTFAVNKSSNISKIQGTINIG